MYVNYITGLHGPIRVRYPLTFNGPVSFVGGLAYVPFQIGTKSSSAGSGLKIVGSGDDSGGIQIYADDGGVAAVGEVITPLRSRYLLTVNQSSGVSQCALFAQLVSGGSGTRTYTTGAFRAAYIFNQQGTTTLVTSAECLGINQATTLVGTMTVGSGCTFAGIDINIRGSGAISNSGTCAALLIRSSETPVWSNAIYIPAGGCVAGLVFGQKSSNSAIGHHIGVANSADTAGDKAIAVFADDANAVLASDAQGINSRCLILHAQNGAYGMDALRGHLRIVASVMPSAQKAFTATSGYVECSGTYTLGDGTNSLMLCALGAAMELGDTPTVAANVRLVGVHVFGKFTADYSNAQKIGVMFEGGGAAYWQYALGFHDGVSGMVTTASDSASCTHKIAVWINGVGARYIHVTND